MPPSAEDRLRDILEAVGEMEVMLAGFDLDGFASDKMRRMATERYLEVICEATRKLADDVKQKAPHIEWQTIIDFGNRLRHAYHATDVKIVWGILQTHLPLLKSFAERQIARSGK